ncbi:hypothetical protein KFE25_003064 [Diacronema lutheri]|uniref:Tetratricopeptide repeat protein n=3 Tax=Diacronema lutheri TaxID=2081491 RepID=A0A8J6C2J9_DIALT|nr:hypothetical protein KFE25_003064 [Diacronema lutheri]
MRRALLLVVALSVAVGAADPAMEAIERGHELRRAGRLAEAIDAYHGAVRAAPEHAPAHMALGNALFAAGEYQRALRSYAVAAGADPTDDQPHVNLCNTLRIVGELDAAVEACQVALRLNPSRPSAHVNLGNALSARGEAAAAVRAFTAAIALDPRDHLAYTNLGSALLADRRLVPAVRAYEKALELEPTFAVAHTNLGNAKKALGDLGGAAESYLRALQLAPDDVVALNNMGTTVAASGRPLEAHEWYERAIAVQPDYAPARRNLAKSTASAEYAAAVRNETQLLRARAASAAAGAGGSRGALSAAGITGSTASRKLQLAFEALRELETAGAESPLWAGRAFEMPEAIAALGEGAEGGASPVTLGAFAWGGVWAQALFRAFAARPVRVALREAQRSGGGAVVLGSSIGFETFFITLTFGVPTTGVELLPGLVDIARRCRAALAIPNVALVNADAVEWPVPSDTRVVFVDDTAWDGETVEAVARKLALELRPGAVVLHNVLGPYEAMRDKYDDGMAVPVGTSWDDAHHIIVHRRI